MKYIEVTIQYTGVRAIIPISSISHITDDDNGSAIYMRHSISVYASESYDTIKKLIQDETYQEARQACLEKLIELVADRK